MTSIIGLVILQILLFSSFKIPSESMEPTLEIGDNVLVGKWIPGARLFNIFDSLQEIQLEIYRIPGTRKIRHNDIVVFNFPHPQTWDKIEMDIMKYYIKRSIGLPGDSIAIKNGLFLVNGYPNKVGNKASQIRIAEIKEENFKSVVYNTFPLDSIINWNIKDFGPLYIPRKGDYITLDRTHYFLYRKLIEWEQQKKLEYKNKKVFLDNKEILTYQFQKNYYFMAGDNGMNSQDSRYWGLLPEEYIVGKAWIIWKSVDPYTGKWRENRFLKKVK